MNKTQNKTLILATIALSLVLGAGCARSAAPQSESSAAPPVAAAPGDLKVGAPLAAGRSLIVTLDVGLTVENVDHARARIRGEVERAGGYVADASSSGSGSDRYAHLELRVPSDKVRSLREGLGAVGEITSDVEKVQDVTDERADLKARLRNSRTQEKRVLEIMGQRTGTIAEVVESERELARIRETIERLEAQERAMDGKIELATVRVSLTSHGTPAWQTPGKSISSAASGGLRAAAAFGVYAAMAFVAAAPFLLPLGLVIAAIVYAARGKRRRLERVLAG
jgi:Domain of unknown function (DUF4349)